MENSLNLPAAMMFNPTGFGLNPGQTSVVGNMEVSEIGLIGAPPPMAGPYIGGGGTVANVYGMWLGPNPDGFGGYTIEFNSVGPYPPVEGQGARARAPAGSGSKTTWKRVDYKQLSLEELECAMKKLDQAKKTYKSNDKALEILDGWSKQVSDAKKKYEA